MSPKQYLILQVLMKTSMPALKPREITREAGYDRGHGPASTAWATRKLERLMGMGLVAKRGPGLYYITSAGRSHVSTVERKRRDRRQRERERQGAGQ